MPKMVSRIDVHPPSYDYSQLLASRSGYHLGDRESKPQHSQPHYDRSPPLSQRMQSPPSQSRDPFDPNTGDIGSSTAPHRGFANIIQDSRDDRIHLMRYLDARRELRHDRRRGAFKNFIDKVMGRTQKQTPTE